MKPLIARLPDELLEHIFDYVPGWVPAMVRMSHVCRRWRHLAFQHPKFCTDIYITDVDDDEIPIPLPLVPKRTARLAAQLASSEQAPLRVTIKMEEWARHAIEAALPLLPAHLHRVVSFNAMCDRGHSSQEVIAMLDTLAPLLQSLCLNAGDYVLVHDSRDMVLPRSFLSGKERLRSLALRLFTFPDDAVASVSIEHLELRMQGDPAQIDRALSACPRLRRLDLSFKIGGMSRSEALSVIRNTRVARLPTVSIQQGYGALPYYGAVLGTHLHGPLCITDLFRIMDRGMTCLDVTICDTSSGRQRLFLRTILAAPDDPDSEPDPAEFRDLGIADRLVELRACVNAIDIVATLFPVLPVLETLTIALRHRRTDTALFPTWPGDWQTFDAIDLCSARFACPALTRIVVVGDGQSCSPAWLAHFVGHVLSIAPRRQLELVLKGTTLSEDPRQIWGYFKSISVYPSEQE